MPAAATPNSRWWIYQRERFPLLTQGPVIAAFSFSAVSFSALLGHRAGPPPAGAVMVAFVTSFVFFLQLRIADEFKDADDDARYRPYRPVPRGLVRLPELAAVAVGGALLQLLLALWLDRKLVGLLIVVWLYLGLMSQEFFMSDWLKAHPFTYMWTHMLIIPLIDLYTSACDWLVKGAALPHGLHWFLAASYCNGMVVEIGRKIRAPEDEERGVETYTAVWGRSTAELLPHCPDLTYGSLRDRTAARRPRTPARRSVLGGGASSRYPRAVFPPSERRAVRAPDLTAPFVHHGRPAPDAKEAGNDRAAIRKRSRGL